MCLLGVVALAACSKSDNSGQTDQFTFDTINVATRNAFLIYRDTTNGVYEIALTDGRYTPDIDNFLDDNGALRLKLVSPFPKYIASNSYRYADFATNIEELSIFEGELIIATDDSTNTNKVYKIVGGSLDITNEDPIFEFTYSLQVRDRNLPDTLAAKPVSGYYKGRLDAVTNK